MRWPWDNISNKASCSSLCNLRFLHGPFSLRFLHENIIWRPLFRLANYWNTYFWARPKSGGSNPRFSRNRKHAKTIPHLTIPKFLFDLEIWRCLQNMRFAYVFLDLSGKCKCIETFIFHTCLKVMVYFLPLWQFSGRKTAKICKNANNSNEGAP